MSIQPQYYDETFGYIVEITPGEHMAIGRSIKITTVHGREIALNPGDIGYKRAMSFLKDQEAPHDQR